MFEILSSPDALVALLTLTFLEIILGIDNIIFIAVAIQNLPIKYKNKARYIGISLALIIRILMLFTFANSTKNCGPPPLIFPTMFLVVPPPRRNSTVGIEVT